MAYKGYVPDNRELVLVNLADKESPQKIIHLYDMQFIAFVGHSFADRESRIGMLCLDQGEVRLCWLITRQPYKKRGFDEMDHLNSYLPKSMYLAVNSRRKLCLKLLI